MTQNIEKLELKHLLPYLTHQLKVRQIPITNLYFDKIVELNGLFISENCATFEKGVDYYFEDDEPDIEIKPLFLPLSELSDEQWIEVFKAGTENCVPPIPNSHYDDHIFEYHDKGIEICFKNSTEISFYYPELFFSTQLRFNQLSAFNKLYELHADLHGLIESGSALNKLEVLPPAPGKEVEGE